MHMLHSVAMFSGMHMRKKMKNPAAIHAVLTHFIRSSMPCPQNQAPLSGDVLLADLLSSDIKQMGIGSNALRRCAWSMRRTSTPLQVEWLSVGGLLASGSAGAMGSII
jgi:hypothetical protein